MERVKGKPTLGATVFGIRNALTGWAFHYQTTVGIDGNLEKRKLFKKQTKKMVTDEVVVGNVCNPSQYSEAACRITVRDGISDVS